MRGSPVNRVDLTSEQLAEAQRLYAEGAVISRIAVAMGLPKHRVRKSLDPVYAAKYSSGIGRRRASRSLGPILHLQTADPSVKQDAMELYRRVPADTRSLTAFLAGDPLPGRSALDRDGVSA